MCANMGDPFRLLQLILHFPLSALWLLAEKLDAKVVVKVVSHRVVFVLRVYLRI